MKERTSLLALRRRCGVLLCLLLVLVPGFSAAEEAADEAPAKAPSVENPADPDAAGAQYELETVVTASRAEERRFEATRSVSVTDRDALIAQQSRSVPESLLETPGMFMQQTNRGAGAPILRGLVGPHNLILVDGVRFNTSVFRTGPNQYLATSDPFALRRVEVVRGPSSVLYGDGAMGGVINLLSSEPGSYEGSIGWGGNALAGFASADRGGSGALQLEAGGAGFAALAGISGNWFGPLTAGGGARQPVSDYQTYGARAKLRYAPDRTWDLTGAYLGTRVDNAGRADNLGKGDLRWYDNVDHLSYLRFRLRDIAVLDEFRVTVSHHRVDEQIERFGCATDGDGVVLDRTACLALLEAQLTRKRRYLDRVDVLGGQIDGGLSFLERRIRLKIGAEVFLEFVDSARADARPDDGWVFQDKDRGNFSDGSRYTTLGVFAHGRGTVWDFGDDVGLLAISGGARFSYFAARAPDVPELGDVEYDHHGFVGSAGIQFLNRRWFNIYASFLQGFRAPNLQESTVLGDTGTNFEVPNDSLGPERSNTLEVGARVHQGPVSAGAAYYHSWLTDFIDREDTTWQGQGEIDGKQVVHRVNAAAGRYQGVEGDFNVALWRFSVNGAVTWTRGEVEDAAGEVEPARRVPPLFGRGGLRYDHPDRSFHVEAFVLWAARQDRLNPGDEKDQRICQVWPYSGTLRDNCNGTPAWFTPNLRGGYRISEALRMDLALLNLTDERYRLHGSGFDAPGFDVRASLVGRF